MSTEADTCRKFVVPKLQAAGWDNDPHSIAEQRSFSLSASTGERAGVRCRKLQRAERGIDFPTVAAQAGKPEADPFDLLCHLAFNAPVLTRRPRADHVKKKQAAMFNYLKPEAQEILNELLEKYAADGELQFVLPDVLKVPPISQHGSVGEIVGVFGGPDGLCSAATNCRNCSMPTELSTLNFQPSTGLRGSDQLRNTVNQLQSLLYAA